MLWQIPTALGSSPQSPCRQPASLPGPQYVPCLCCSPSFKNSYETVPCPACAVTVKGASGWGKRAVSTLDCQLVAFIVLALCCWRAELRGCGCCCSACLALIVFRFPLALKFWASFGAQQQKKKKHVFPFFFFAFK